MADKTPASNGQAMQVDTDLVRQLATVLEETKLTEIEVQDGERRIRLVRQVTVSATTTMVAAPAAAPAAAAVSLPTQAPAATTPSTPGESKNHPGSVKSPMVGTVYLTPEPGAPAFVTEGAQVKEGDTLVIIEAMKVMNPITAPRAGKVVKICVQNEQPVEYDTSLVIIE